MHKKIIKKQSGFGVLGALLALIIFSIMVTIYIKFQYEQKIKTNSQILANNIAVVVKAVKFRLSTDRNFKGGVYDIKSMLNKSCGGLADDNYLPCGFSLKNDIYDGDVKIFIPEKNTKSQIFTASIETDPIGFRNFRDSTIEPKAFLAGETLLNSQADTKDSAVAYSLDKKNATIKINMVVRSNLTNIPVGTILEYSGASAPTSYYQCNGQKFSVDNNPDLYKVLGAKTVPKLDEQQDLTQPTNFKLMYIIRHD